VSRVTVAGVEVSTEHFVGGERVASDATFTDLSPIDAQPLAEIARGGEREADLAVAAATEAFPAWAALGAAGRAAHLHRLAGLIDANVDRLAAVECADMAMLLRSLRARVINRGARNFRAYADLAVAHDERVWESNGTRNRVIRMPSGPAVVITPWNAPFMLSTWKTAPALAAGCTVILKPAEWSPLSCSLLCDLVAEAGFPPGVFNVVQGIGEEIGAALTRHPGVRRISFTGSPETAVHIGTAAARNVVPFTGELGGKGPLLVFADAELEAAAATAAVAVWSASGQVCTAGSRVLVERPIYDDFVARVADVSRDMRIGSPFDEQTAIGPVVSQDQLERITRYVGIGRDEGDSVLLGGNRHGDVGYFFEPTIFTSVSNNMRIAQEEIFGPVMCAIPFDSEDEAFRVANDVEYGLAAGVWTNDLARTHRAYRTLKAGTVWINTYGEVSPSVPYGGVKQSGHGRTLGEASLDELLQTKSVWMKLAH
jgi:acyl-CoA reductase-like NAD-dependent aldehyde dehydrogenase